MKNAPRFTEYLMASIRIVFTSFSSKNLTNPHFLAIPAYNRTFSTVAHQYNFTKSLKNGFVTTNKDLLVAIFYIPGNMISDLLHLGIFQILPGREANPTGKQLLSISIGTTLKILKNGL